MDNTFDDRFRGKFAGNVNWTLLPERLDWVFEDYMSPQQIDEFASSSPDNEQQVNLFVTGPTLYARFGAATRGQFDLRYGNSYAEENDEFNGDRYSAAARVLHDDRCDHEDQRQPGSGGRPSTTTRRRDFRLQALRRLRRL